MHELPWHDPPWEDSNILSPTFAMKPLPPLPRRKLYNRRTNPGSRENASRCILTRIRRTRAESLPGDQSTTIQQRRNVTATPQLTLSVPQQTLDRANTAPPALPTPSPTPMVWMPEEQMWLISDDTPSHNYLSDYPPPTYTSRAYAHSEPSPVRSSWHDLSPVRSQFRNLMEPPSSDRLSHVHSQYRTPSTPIGHQDPDRLSPRFQEAIPMMDPGLPSPVPSAGCAADPADDFEEDWESEDSSRSSWHSAASSLPPEPAGAGSRCPWEGLTLRLARPGPTI